MKTIQPIRFNQIGSLYNFPNWRYLVYLEPHRANLEYCHRKPIDGAQCLVRYIGSNEELAKEASVNFSLTSVLSRAVKSMNMAQADLFYKLFNKKLRDGRQKKIFVPSYKKESIKVWSCKYIDKITDKPLQDFLYHAVKVKHSKDYDFAIKYHSSAEHQRSYCVIGYNIFAGVSDAVIANRYKLYPGQIKALRELFFDFSNAPTDVVARAAYFTQLSDNQVISDVDRRYYKIIGSLGELGLRADADPTSLDEEEKNRLNSYLADSMLDNVTSLYFTIENKKDALAYNTVINNLASFHMKKEEINYFRAKVKHLNASTTRITNERTNYDSSMQEEDVLALEMIQEMALRENPLPVYKTLLDLKDMPDTSEEDE